ncbi:hypothetical protein NP493_2g12000 [Ridgeia piscesae]|uniref:Calponin-homology (CH) domain-containing protein n=1 Tax=Ridgeia piscesae TaxID=27915 RepID=A0AAD9PG97_RIDPI|nr:hypothetical protein NP493_2g12000 [Ridgeia piscesae]
MKAKQRVVNLFEDLRDGNSLISLLEVLSQEPLPRERGRMRFHKLQNVRIALDFLRSKGIRLVNIRPDEITDGNPKLTLGLIWTIILHFQFTVYMATSSYLSTAQASLFSFIFFKVPTFSALQLATVTAMFRYTRHQRCRHRGPAGEPAGGASEEYIYDFVSRPMAVVMHRRVRRTCHRSDVLTQTVKVTRDTVQHTSLSRCDTIRHASSSRCGIIRHGSPSRRDVIRHSSPSRRDVIRHASPSRRDTCSIRSARTGCVHKVLVTLEEMVHFSRTEHFEEVTSVK